MGVHWLRVFHGRFRSLAAITRKSGVSVAGRLAWSYAANLIARAQAFFRPPIHVRSSTSDERQTRFISLDPSTVFQPKSQTVEQLAQLDLKDTANLTRLSAEKVIYRDVPYSKYMGQWQFHPGRIGGELARLNLADLRLERIAAKVKDQFVRLPNGGLALYYPKTFRVTRLKCQEYIYSAIAQGQLLAGYSRLAKSPHLSPETRATWRDMSAAIAASLQFPFQDGGVNLEGKVLLETPNFRSPPEIILNGWIDALIHLHDYLDDGHGTATLRDLFDANIETLAQLLPQFDDERMRLSKYSNLSPYRLRLQFRMPLVTVPRVRLEYRSLVNGFDSFRIDNPRIDGKPGPCFFENAIIGRPNHRIDLLVSSSALYALDVCVGAQVQQAELDSGPYGIWSHEAAGGGRRIVIDPGLGSSDETVIAIPSGLLMTGQPTDFAKGYNFYHTYHVAALFELSRMTKDDPARRTIREFALKWLDYINSPAPAAAGSQFSDPNRILRQIANGRGRRKASQLADFLGASATV